MIETISGTNPVSAFGGMFADPANRWFALYLLASFVMAFTVFLLEAKRDSELLRAGLFRYLFPKRVYAHRSAIADYYFFVVNKLLFAVAFGALIAVSASATNLISALLATMAVSFELPVPSWGGILITTLVWALAMDFGLWLGHYLLHKVPVLWEFHKVHHSAEVLTPLTAGRVHPVEDAINILFSGSFAGIALALCRFLLGPKATMLGLFQLNMLVAVFYLFGFHLRHSHIWLPYKGIWGRLFVSPAHHQLHHSQAQRHWDKNLGFVFAFWDWAFGTLYPVDERETFEIGMNGHEEGEYHSVRAMYLLPFVKAWRRIRGQRAEIPQLTGTLLPPSE
jgi:sterol desaturase/sphingolipid hydroxylase (fatty acid hydroxylase superfamily)